MLVERHAVDGPAAADLRGARARRRAVAAEKVIPIVNALLDYVPHFLALSASSPFWLGGDTGLASYRSKVFEGLPTAGLPYQLHDWDEFEQLHGALIKTGAIETVREVWWDIRPHPDFGTVELRICDGLPTLDEVGRRRGDGAVPGRAAGRPARPRLPLPEPRAWVVRENKWRAARYGLDAEIVVDDARHRATGARSDPRAGRRPHTDRPPARLRGRARDSCRGSSSTVRATSDSAGSPPARAVSCALSWTHCWRRCGWGCRCDGTVDRAARGALAGSLAGRARLRPGHVPSRAAPATPSSGTPSTAPPQRLAAALSGAGLQPHVLPVGTGAVLRHRHAAKRVVALRADIDALPLQDAKDVPYASIGPGRLPRLRSRCAHDRRARRRRSRWPPDRSSPGRVRLIFQPAEEAVPGGALDAIDGGVLKDVERIFALHCDPKLETGRVGLRAGPITAACDKVDVLLSGPGGHTARPHRTVDLVYALGRVITDAARPAVPAGRPARTACRWCGARSRPALAPNTIPQSGDGRAAPCGCSTGTPGTRAEGLVTALVEQVVAPTGATVEVRYTAGRAAGGQRRRVDGRVPGRRAGGARPGRRPTTPSRASAARTSPGTSGTCRARWPASACARPERPGRTSTCTSRLLTSMRERSP